MVVVVVHFCVDSMQFEVNFCRIYAVLMYRFEVLYVIFIRFITILQSCTVSGMQISHDALTTMMHFTRGH